jgi:hypothetical protein
MTLHGGAFGLNVSVMMCVGLNYGCHLTYIQILNFSYDVHVEASCHDHVLDIANNFFETFMIRNDTFPSSLIDSNVSLR